MTDIYCSCGRDFGEEHKSWCPISKLGAVQHGGVYGPTPPTYAQGQEDVLHFLEERAAAIRWPDNNNHHGWIERAALFKAVKAYRALPIKEGE